MADSDGDGVDDGAEIRQGLDPVEGGPSSTGVLAGVGIPGTGTSLAIENDVAVVADDEGGLSVFNVFSSMNPVTIGRLDLPSLGGDVASTGDLVAVSDQEGIVVVDISDPPAAEIVRTIDLSVAARTVAAEADVAYAGLTREVVAVDMRTGGELARRELDGTAADLELSGGHLHAVTNDTLYILETVERGLDIVGRVDFGSRPGAPLERGPLLFVGTETAYVGYFRGFLTIDISDPEQPRVIGEPPDVQAAIHDLAANGSGLLVTVTSFAGKVSLDVSLYDVSDPTDVTGFLTSFGFAEPRRAAIFNGLAHVTGGFGFSVLSYLPPDRGTLRRRSRCPSTRRSRASPKRGSSCV